MLSLQDLHSQLDEFLAINSVESSFSREFYTDLINGQRSLWLRNEYNKNRSVDPYVVQTIPCLEVETANPIDCCISVPQGCSLLRTTQKIPNTIEFFYTKGVVSVGPADITRPRFTLIDYSRVPFIGHGRTTSKSIYAFIYNGYLYFISKGTEYLFIKRLTVRLILEDPTQLSEFTNCETGSGCWKPSDPYPLNLWMWEYIKPYITQQLLQKSTLQLDESNNAQDGKSQPNTQ